MGKMTGCPDPDALSAYADGEAHAAEAERIAAHAPHCLSCRRSLEVLGRLKSKLRAQPSPAMPRALRASLERMAIPSAAAADREWTVLGAVPSQWRPALVFCLAGAALALALWWKVESGKKAIPPNVTREMAQSIP